MSLSKTLCLKAVDTIAKKFNMEEDGDPKITLTSPMAAEPVGKMQVWKGDDVQKMVYIGLSVEQIGLDSHMVFAFTPPGSATPHFTLDSIMTGDFYAFHLDMISRVELATHLTYMDHCYTPLTDVYEETRKIDGLTEAHLSPRQLALMSPWMLANRATEDAFANITPAVDSYLNHWMGLVENGLGDAHPGLDEDVLGKHDQIHRDVLFNPDVDPVWAQVSRLVGEEVSEQLRGELITQD